MNGKAVGLEKYLPIDNEQSLLDLNINTPEPTGNDILVEVKAISVNPVDVKIRAPKDKVEKEPRILGWDAAGVIVAVGDKVDSLGVNFKVGDEVFYAGDITRPGTNSQYQLVDARIVGRKPKSLDFAKAASLPLTAITAWECLFDRMHISKTGAHAGKSVLIIGGAGGVGSIAIQIAKKVAKLEVIATASRPETIDWCKKLGADHVVNHRNNLAEELQKIGIKSVDYILCLNDTLGHLDAMAESIKPQGIVCSIVETDKPFDINPFKAKSVAFAWELMFTRSLFQTEDIIEQHKLLNEVSQLIDNGTLVHTTVQTFSPINAANLREVHKLVESGRAIGKIVLSDW